jgi:hypothetical protein
MRGISLIFVICLGSASFAEAQPSAAIPKWDVGASIGFFQAAPGETETEYSDDWYSEGRYAVSIGRYWTNHLKTEFEVATTGEGSRYAQRYALTVPGVPPYYSYPVTEYYQLHQLSGRLIWQFFDNAWVHPYVFGGVSLDIERTHAHVPEHYFYSGGGPNTPPNRILVTSLRETPPETLHRAGLVLGVGTKIYMTRRAYFNTAVITSHAKPTRTVSLIGGFGVDF